MKHTDTFTSYTKTHIYYDIYTPIAMIRHKAIVQIHHGIGEYKDRYTRFAEFLALQGYVVVVSDFPGHGASLHNARPGSFGPGKAEKTLVADMRRLHMIISQQFPDLSYFMLANQFGSYVLRQYMCLYGETIQGAILMGTMGKSNAFYIDWLRMHLCTLLQGKNSYSSWLFHRLNRRWNLPFLPLKTNIDYLTSDGQERRRYQKDPLTQLLYTNQSYKDIMHVVSRMKQLEKKYRQPSHLPIFILSGKRDVFGNMGKGPTWLYKQYVNHVVQDVTLKLYEDCRADILHEVKRKEVYRDILDWLNERAKNQEPL